MSYENEYQALLKIILGSDRDFCYYDPQYKAMLSAIDRAQKAILKYTRWPTMEEGYENVTAALALQYFLSDRKAVQSFSGNQPVSQQTQGSRSVTYRFENFGFDKDGLTAEIKAALPYPMLRVF